MNANELANELDRLHEKLYLHWDEDSPRLQNAATMLRQQQSEIEAKELYINRLHKLCNENGLGVGKNLLTGEVIPFEVNDEQ